MKSQPKNEPLPILETTPPSFVDPVCGMSVDPATSAASLERDSEHPLAGAIVKEAIERKQTLSATVAFHSVAAGLLDAIFWRIDFTSLGQRRDEPELCVGRQKCLAANEDYTLTDAQRIAPFGTTPTIMVQRLDVTC
jgi:cation transport ATPase